MDNTAKLWAVDTGEELASLLGHTAEIVSLCFNNEGDKIITGATRAPKPPLLPTLFCPRARLSSLYEEDVLHISSSGLCLEG